MPRMISIEDLGQYPTEGEESSGWRDDAYMSGMSGPARTRRQHRQVEETEETDEE